MKDSIRYIDCVYIVECNGLYKIGRTSHLDSRLNAIQTATPFPVQLVYAIPCPMKDREIEHALHVIFADHRVRGEWFKLSMRDIAKIKSLSVQEILSVASRIEAAEKPGHQLAFDFGDDE